VGTGTSMGRGKCDIEKATVSRVPGKPGSCMW
jgi:hypothetical protein